MRKKEKKKSLNTSTSSNNTIKEETMNYYQQKQQIIRMIKRFIEDRTKPITKQEWNNYKQALMRKTGFGQKVILWCLQTHGLTEDEEGMITKQ